MEFIQPEIQAYAERHTSPENEVLSKVNRDTHAKIMMPRMLSGHLQGRLLSMLSYMLKPRLVLEIGTYTGYSALCLAEGMSSEGKLITIDINEELEEQVRAYFETSSFGRSIDYRIGDAKQIIPGLTEIFDLVFIDADKESCSMYYDMIIDKMQPGGVILVDNVLWSGKVIQEKQDKDTRAIVEFNRKIHQDRRVENVLLPVRDGIMMIRKLSL
jgi:predicted O-methyltransferase YrrM